MSRGELEALRAAYEAMVEHAPEAITVVDLSVGRFIEVNRSACELFGLSREELLRSSPASLSPERQPDGRLSTEAAHDHLERAAAGEIHAFEWLHLHAGGEEIPCRVQLALVPAGERQLVRGSILDLRPQREASRAQRRFHEMLEAMPSMVAMADPEGRLLYMNPATRRALEIDDEEQWRGSRIIDWIPDPEALPEVLREAARTGMWRGEGAFVSRSGRLIPTEHIVLAHKSERGQIEYYSSVATDITERLAAARLERKMQQAQKLESLGLLAGGIAHDFNNILVGILGNAALARDEADPQARQEALHQIQTAARRAAQLAQQMLTFAGQAEPAKVTLDVVALVQDVIALTKGAMRQGIEVTIEHGDDVPPMDGDPTQLRQVLMNLIINASDAMSHGGTIAVRLGVGRPDEAALLYNHLEPGAGELLQLEVADSGTGIDVPVEQIFDPFFTTKFAGQGLGLAAVLGIVRRHRGAIGVETGPEGTTFKLWFPAGASSHREEQEDMRGGEWRGEGTILVVDDEDMVRRVLRLSVERLGFDVLEAGGGEDAVRLFHEHHAELRGVILDLTMPGSSGSEVMQEFRRIDEHVPIVLTSGYSDEVTSADGFLPKPFRPAEVAALLERVLTRTA